METETRPPVEEQEEKRKIVVLEVIAKKCAGTVKWYSHKLLYGFISRSDNKEDVFVHRTAITASNNRTLRNGEEVEFSVVRTNNGIEAYNVTGPEGAPVKGFSFIRRRRRPNRGPPRDQADGDNDNQNEVKEEDRPQRRRRFRGRGGRPTNGETNGTHSEGDVYYEPGENGNSGDSPSAGESRRVKEGGFTYGRRGRGGFRGGRGGPRPYSVRGGRGGAPRGARRGGAHVDA